MREIERRKFKGEDYMRIFIGLITLSATASKAVGVYTNDIFNAFALYTPLSLISIVIKDGLEDRKIKKILKESK
ncbi:hypothetical protein QI204_11275 [Staphylococcus saprophyticus]|uniref:hypothetical protein n=2 Tax=Staphylococcus saprophyticus TaxID=29385 RepID=UPI00210EC50F|nr:hypothetical protein [Staphylococcus saprophyticus]MDW4342527.1 hypothetical protein [Staphylococcus saprophyticus]MDW4386964.1 hypothetical protein [Staphylococcus saprophyticus]UUY79495.1 hypothetical protein NUT40_05420 [Staphylococcus saprophyticus]